MRIDRREFLAGAVAGAAGSVLGLPLMAADAKPADPFQLVALGKTGLKVSLIGIGTGMKGWKRQSNQTRAGKEHCEALIKGAYERGIRLFDMADLYGTHPYVAAALKGLPRDQYVLVTKIWVNPDGLPENERPDANVVIDRFRKELDTDYIDLVLIHCMTSARWPEDQKKQMDIMADLKSKGTIRAHGVSIHSLDAMRAAIESPWVDSVHARINPFGMSMDGKVEEVAPLLKKLRAAGKGVVGMKIIGEGRLRNDDAKKDESIRYAITSGCMDAMVVGFEKLEEIDDFSARARKVISAV